VGLFPFMSIAVICYGGSVSWRGTRRRRRCGGPAYLVHQTGMLERRTFDAAEDAGGWYVVYVSNHDGCVPGTGQSHGPRHVLEVGQFFCAVAEDAAQWVVDIIQVAVVVLALPDVLELGVCISPTDSTTGVNAPGLHTVTYPYSGERFGSRVS
jgi:hypothetical protein